MDVAEIWRKGGIGTNMAQRGEVATRSQLSLAGQEHAKQWPSHHSRRQRARQKLNAYKLLAEDMESRLAKAGPSERTEDVDARLALVKPHLEALTAERNSSGSQRIARNLALHSMLPAALVQQASASELGKLQRGGTPLVHIALIAWRLHVRATKASLPAQRSFSPVACAAPGDTVLSQPAFPTSLQNLPKAIRGLCPPAPPLPYLMTIDSAIIYVGDARTTACTDRTMPQDLHENCSTHELLNAPVVPKDISLLPQPASQTTGPCAHVGPIVQVVGNFCPMCNIWTPSTEHSGLCTDCTCSWIYKVHEMWYMLWWITQAGALCSSSQLNSQLNPCAEYSWSEPCLDVFFDCEDLEFGDEEADMYSECIDVFHIACDDSVSESSCNSEGCLTQTNSNFAWPDPGVACRLQGAELNGDFEIVRMLKYFTAWRAYIANIREVQLTFISATNAGSQAACSHSFSPTDRRQPIITLTYGAITAGHRFCFAVGHAICISIWTSIVVCCAFVGSCGRHSRKKFRNVAPCTRQSGQRIFMWCRRIARCCEFIRSLCGRLATSILSLWRSTYQLVVHSIYCCCSALTTYCAKCKQLVLIHSFHQGPHVKAINRIAGYYSFKRACKALSAFRGQVYNGLATFGRAPGTTVTQAYDKFKRYNFWRKRRMTAGTSTKADVLAGVAIGSVRLVSCAIICIMVYYIGSSQNTSGVRLGQKKAIIQKE